MDVFTHFSIVRRERRGIRPEEIKPTFRPLVVETNSCSSPCVVRLLAITKNYEVSHSSQRSPACLMRVYLNNLVSELSDF
jgi:hypothetical protein